MPEGKNICPCCDVAIQKGGEAGRSDEYDQRTPGAGFLTKEAFSAAGFIPNPEQL